MANAGIIIDVQTSGAINSLEKFREALTKSGVTAKSTTEEIQKLEKGFNEKLKADETARKLELARNQIERIGRAAGLSAVEVKRLGDSMGVNMSHMNTGAQSASRLSAATSMLGGSFSSLVPAIGGAVLAYMSLSKAVGAVHAYMERGIEFNKQMESSALGISSILAATQNISTLDGRRLEGQERLNAAMSVAKGLMDEIQVLGVQTTSTTKDLVQGFQTLLGPASEAGLSLGQTKDVVVNIVQAMSALGIKTQELSQEGRALLTGDIDRNARLATSLQITKSMVDEWKSQGTLFENISKKLEAFKLAGSASAQTWEGLTSNIAEAADIISGMGTKGLFEGSKQGFSTILSSLLQIKDDALVAGDSVSNITAGLASMGDDLGGFVAGSAQTLVEKFGELNTWIAHNKEELGEIYDKTAAILGSIIDILGYFGNILTTVASVAVETGTVSTALSFAHGIVVLIEEAVGYIELAFRAVGVVILKNVCGPLASAARLALHLNEKANILGGDQVAGLNNYASGLEQNITDAEAALQKSASRYSNTPFPAITKANAEVQKLNDNLKETKKQAAGFKLSSPGGYSETDSEKLMKGNGSAQYRLNQEWKEGLAALAQLDAKIKSGTLSNEDMTRALNDQKAVWDHIGEAQDSFEKKANKGSKAAERAAIAAERYSAAQQAFYDQTMASMDQIHDSLTGGFEKNAQGIDKSYERIFDSIRQKVIDAKGDVSGYAAVWVEAWNRWPGDKQLAVLKDQTNELKKQAQLLKDIADATGDPAMQAKASVYDADAWYAERKQQIENTYKDEAEKAAMMAALQEGYNAKLLKGRADAYEGVAAVSSKYWEAEKQLLAQRLQGVKKEATDELAFRVYAAQQEDELRKKQLESQAQYAGTFAETLSAKWSLAFGGYKSETTKAKESWDQMSDSIIQATDGMIDGIAGGFGDMIRNIGNGTASIEDLWKNMLSRMLDAFASFVEELIKKQLQNLLGSMFSGSSTGSGTGSVSIGNISSNTSGGSDWKSIGKSIGSSIVGSFASGSSEASTFLKGLSKANTDGISDVFKNGNISGWNFSDGSSVTGDAIKQASGITSSASSILGTVGSVLGVVGAIGGIVGLVSSLFGEKKEEIKKVASGYNVGYNAGHSTAYGVDFYSDGSVQYAGPSNPDVQKKISDAFRETAEALSDFAEELGFTVDVLEGFQMPNMNITDDQLDSYIRNGENMMAFKGLMEAGLRGAFDYVARDGEVYVDEYERLSTSLSTVRGGLEAYGYELSDVAMITQEQLDAIRAKNTEVAEGTAQAMAAFAASMGATDEVLAQIARDTPDATAALAATDEQLSSILEADYASDLLDAVGGEDAFAAMMTNLTKNVFDTISAYAENLTYYNEKATSAIGKLNEAGVTVDNFWERFNEAIKKGLTVDEFEAWGKASTWVNQIDSVTQAMEDWANAMRSVSQSLEVRKLKALGQDDAASLLDTVYKQEQELAQARKDGYDAAVLLQLQEVQLLELRRAEAELARKGWEVIQDLNVREKELNNDPYAEAAQAYYDNGWELKEAMESGLYSPGDLARLADIQKREIQKYYDEIAQTIQTALDGVRDQLDAVSLSEVANWLKDLQQAFAETIQETTRLGASEEQLAEVRAAEAALIQHKLLDVIASVTDQLDAVRLTDTGVWLADLHESVQLAIEDATLLGATEEQLAEIRAAEAELIRDKLSTVLESVQTTLDEATLTDMESWLKDLSQQMNQAESDARALGASERELSRIRQAEAEIIADKLSEMMDGVMRELSTFDGTELAYNVKSLKSTMADQLYEAALLGATEADLTQIGTLYAYKVKDAYQDQIDDIVSQLETAANALDSFSDSLKEFLEGLWTNDDSPLALGDRYAEAGRQWRSAVADLSSPDDKVRAAAQDNIEALTTDYLQLSKDYNADFSAYYADFMTVQAILGDQYQQAKTEYEILSDQLKAATGAEENTKTTAELLDQLKALQLEQGDTWTQMLAELPEKIAEAMKKAEEYKAAIGAYGSSASVAAVTQDFQARDAAAQAAASQYLQDKAAQLSAETGETWTIKRTLQAIQDAGLTPFQHYERYGASEGLAWSDDNAFNGNNTSYTRWTNDPPTGLLEYSDPADYLTAKAVQMSAATGEAWTVQQVAQAIKDAGLTLAEHYLQYGQYEGIKAGSGYVGSNDYVATGSSFNAQEYYNAKAQELTASTGRDWTGAEAAAAIAQAGLTAEQHYQQYGQYEDIPGFAEGGYIPGYSASDVMLAKLRLGEFVMTPEAVSHYGLEYMEALNQRKLPGYAAGGCVGRDVLAEPIRPVTAGTGSSGDSKEVVALRQEVVALRETVAAMSARMDKLLSKLVVNSDGMAIYGVKVREVVAS